MPDTYVIPSGQPQPTGGYVPGGYLPQSVYLSAAADPAGSNLKTFIKDWIYKGGRGIEGGDGQPASYWDVYQDLLARGVDVSDLPKPEALPQGTAKGGGQNIALVAPAASGQPSAPAAKQTSPELTNLLSRLGIDYKDAPAPTPALLAFLNQMSSSMGTAEAAKNTAEQQIGQRGADATAQQGVAYDRTRQNVTADLVRRGVLQSGEAGTRYDRASQDNAYKLSDISRTQAEGVSAADTAYQTAIDATRQQALGKVMDTEQSQAMAKAQSDAQAEAYRQQQQATDAASQKAEAAQRAYQEWLQKQLTTQQQQVA